MTEQLQYHYKSGLQMPVSLRQLYTYCTLLSRVQKIVHVSAMLGRRKNTQLALYETAKHEAIKKLQPT